MPAITGQPATTATAIAQFLKRNGFNTVPRGREGIHVSGTGRVQLTVSVDRAGEHRRLVEAVLDLFGGEHCQYTLTESQFNAPHELVWGATITRKAV